MTLTPTISPERWAELYREHFPRLYRALAAVLRDGDRALDALHDAFLEGLEHPPAADANLVGWIYRVALRKARRFRLRALMPRGQGDEIERALDRLEVGRMLSRLSERQRAVVVAQFYLGLRQREIAECFHIKVGTVSATVASARARLRTEVSDA